MKDHFLTKLPAVAAAVLIWALVGVENGGQEAIEAAVRFVNVPAGTVVNPDQIPETTVVLSGPRATLARLRADGLALQIDCSGAAESEQRTVTVSEQSLELPRQVKMIRALPSQLRFTLDRLETREVAVNPHFEGSPEPGHALEGYSIDPPRLRVSGPAQRVRLVEAVDTDPIRLDGLIGPRTFSASAFLADPYASFEDSPVVLVHVRIQPR